MRSCVGLILFHYFLLFLLYEFCIKKLHINNGQCVHKIILLSAPSHSPSGLSVLFVLFCFKNEIRKESYHVGRANTCEYGMLEVTVLNLRLSVLPLVKLEKLIASELSNAADSFMNLLSMRSRCFFWSLAQSLMRRSAARNARSLSLPTTLGLSVICLAAMESR